MTVSLPLTTVLFTPEKQISFRLAIAATAEVLVEDVVIVDMKEVQSRRAGSLLVTTDVLAQDDAAGNRNASLFEDMGSLNTKLDREGLPGVSRWG